MNANNTITYTTSGLHFHSILSNDQDAQSFLLAVFSTILSYQISGIVIDLILGTKPKGMATSSHFGLFLLSIDSTISSVLTGLTNNYSTARLRGKSLFTSSSNPEPPSEHPTERPSLRNGARLIVLLIAAPLANFFAVAITLEVDSSISFQEAGFSGFSVGTNPDSSFVSASHRNSQCERLKIEYEEGDSSVAEFYRCAYSVSTDVSPDDPPVRTFVLSQGSRRDDAPLGAIITQYTSPPSDANSNATLLQYVITLDIVVDSDCFRVLPSMSTEDGVALFDKMVQNRKIFSSVNANTRQIEAEEIVLDSTQFPRWKISQQAEPGQVDRFSWEYMGMVISNTEKVTLINSNETAFPNVATASVSASGNIEMIDISALRFLKRRRIFVSLIELMIMVIGVIVCRGVVRLFTNNDVFQGVEVILKERFGVKCCDSLLQEREVFSYTPAKPCV